MILTAYQTPTAKPTPAATYRGRPLALPDEETSQIEALLDGLGQNSMGRYDRPHPLDKTIARIDALRTLQEGWNGYDVAAPNTASIAQAQSWIRSMYHDAALACESWKNSCPWTEPHVSANEDGDVTFEWWNGDKKLTAYVSPKESWYIKVWGANVLDEMSDGSADSARERQDIWAWLMN